ncbi:unnamed protein product [Linum trigynum]|uniref:Uncharacterized protein n=1 Tax=Linum trigynum TaxID=586398 RepID=A0AAV2D9Y4_9ROSI
MTPGARNVVGEDFDWSWELCRRRRPRLEQGSRRLVRKPEAAEEDVQNSKPTRSAKFEVGMAIKFHGGIILKLVYAKAAESDDSRR